MTHPPMPRLRRLVFRLLVVYVIVGLVWSVICTIDLALHPLAPATYYLDSVAWRLVIGLLIGPLTIAVGALVLRRERRNIVALLLILIGVSWVTSGLRTGIDNGWVIALNSFYGGSRWGALFLLILYFPDGAVFPPRLGRWVDGYAFLFVVLFAIPAAMADSTVSQFSPSAAIPLPSFPNPLYWPPVEPLVRAIQSVGVVHIFLVMGVGVVSMILRYRSGDENRRLQIRWLAWCFAVFMVMAIIGAVFNTFQRSDLPSALFNLVVYTWLALFPVVAIGNAILRHRLYDIDIIIRRTLVYSILTTILAAMYFGGVVLIQRIFQAAVGATPDVAIVISTLLIAGLFSPIRRRVQDTIDRRFYRRKYNAEQTLAKFNQSLRDEVDIETLKDSLVSVVQETMQPTQVSLWVKEAGRQETKS